MTVRVLLVDDQALLRSGFRMVLEEQDDIEVAGEAADGDEAVARAAELSPDVVLMDVRMPGSDGIDATRRIVDQLPAVRVLILTAFDLDEYAEVAGGLSNQEIAAKLCLAEASVKTHLGRILARLALRDRVQAVVYAYQTGLVRPGGAQLASLRRRLAEMQSVRVVGQPQRSP